MARARSSESTSSRHMDVSIEVVDHNSQNYETVGDWIFSADGHRLQIKVSRLSDWRHEALVGIHELIEAVLCKEAGIDQELVNVFDRAFEEMRPLGNQDEPGHDPGAPYHRQHRIADAIERLLATELGVDWGKYDLEVASLAQDREEGDGALTRK